MSRGRVLLVCYYFPPLGLAGVTRPLNLFKYLPQHGYECNVLTVKPVAYRKYEPELLEGLDESKIYRAGSRDPQRLMYLLGIREVNPKAIARGTSLGESLFPDSKVGWVAPAVRLGKKLHRRNGFTAIISTSPPISSHLVGMQVAKETGLPWVADFRDLWTLRPIEQSYQSPQNVARARELLRQIQRQAATVVTVNDSMANYLGAQYVVSNGVDPELARLWTLPKDNDQFTIGILGTLSDSSPIVPLLSVLDGLRASYPELFERVRLLQVGNAEKSWLQGHLERFCMADRCTSFGLQPRRGSIAILSQSHMMYLGLDAQTAHITTARMYDILASGRPILAYGLPESDLGKLVEATDNGLVFYTDTPSKAVEFLADHIRRQDRRESCIEPLPSYARPYLWDRLAGRYAQLLDGIV